MEKLFGMVWILILLAVYVYFWAKVISDIKTVSKYYEPIKVFRHLERFSKFWIITHIAIIFLMSLSAWEG